MASSSTDPSLEPILNELKAIRLGTNALVKQQQELTDVVCNAMHLLDGFTDGGSSFRAYQIDPMVIMYAAILGPILGDRLDSQVSKGLAYEDDMIRGAVPYARRLLRELDGYLSQSDGRSYLEHMAGDINTNPPPEPPLPTKS